MKKSLDILKDRKTALQQRLKAVQEEIKRKEAAKAAREASQARKTRTHVLILAGALFEALIKYGKIPAEQTAEAAEAYYGNQIRQAQGQTAKKGETPEKHAKRVEKQIAKLERDRNLLITSLLEVAPQTAHP